jgi:hypothetical protein
MTEAVVVPKTLFNRVADPVYAVIMRAAMASAA